MCHQLKKVFFCACFFVYECACLFVPMVNLCLPGCNLGSVLFEFFSALFSSLSFEVVMKQQSKSYCKFYIFQVCDNVSSRIVFHSYFMPLWSSLSNLLRDETKVILGSSVLHSSLYFEAFYLAFVDYPTD